MGEDGKQKGSSKKDSDERALQGQDGSACKGPEAVKGLRDLRIRKKAERKKPRK